MIFNLFCTPLFLLMVTMSCQGFDFSMDRRVYFVKRQTYCGLLQCQVDTVMETNMASLIKMDIYYLNNQHLLASMLPEISEIQNYTGNNTILFGSMSKNHGEMRVYFSDVSNCSETAFICKIQFKNTTHGKENAEKVILPIHSDQNEADIHVKSQISIEHIIFDKSGGIMKKLKSYVNLKNEGNGFDFTLGHPGLVSSDTISKQRNNTETISWENAENNFEQKLSDFEVKIRKQLEVFMNQMSSKIEDIKFTQKEINSNFKDVTQEEMVRISQQSISTLIQSHIDPKLSTLERRINDIIDNIDQFNVLLNSPESRTHTSGFEIIQKLNFLLDDNKLIGLNVSTVGINVTEILNNERQIKDTMREILKNDKQMNDNMTEILNNDRQMNDKIKEILNNDRQMNDKMTEILNKDRQMDDKMTEILNNDRQMNDTIKEILNNDRQMNDTMKEILKNEKQINDTMNEILNNDRHMNKTMKEMLNNDRQIKDTMTEILRNDRQIKDKMNDILKNEGQMNDTMEEMLKNDRQMNDTAIKILNNDRQINDNMSEILKNDRQMNNKMTEILNNDRQLNDTTKEIQHDVNNINKLLREGEMMGEIQQYLTLLQNKLNVSKFLNVEVTMGEVVRELQYNNLTLNDLKQSVNDKCNGDVFRHKTDQRLSSLEEHLEELRIIQETRETLTVNGTGSFNKRNTSGDNQLQLKCERGMSSAQGSRVITSLDNKKQVLCDTETDGGGWIIIQRRANGQVNFTRNWDDYTNGFGSLDGDFWIGNDVISNITSKEIYTLRIDVRNGSNSYNVEYDSFMVKNESDNYRLHLGVFSGNIRDSMRWHSNTAFSTPDRENDKYSGYSCALSRKSGWWYKACDYSNLNGMWGVNTTSGICWWEKSGWKYLDFVEMKIRLKKYIRLLK